VFFALSCLVNIFVAALTHRLIAAQARRVLLRLETSLDGAESEMSVPSPAAGATLTLFCPMLAPFVLAHARGMRGAVEGLAILWAIPLLLGCSWLLVLLLRG
jgi:hypothetical protein